MNFAKLVESNSLSLSYLVTLKLKACLGIFYLVRRNGFAHIPLSMEADIIIRTYKLTKLAKYGELTQGNDQLHRKLNISVMYNQ